MSDMNNTKSQNEVQTNQSKLFELDKKMKSIRALLDGADEETTSVLNRNLAKIGTERTALVDTMRKAKEDKILESPTINILAKFIALRLKASPDRAKTVEIILDKVVAKLKTAVQEQLKAIDASKSDGDESDE